MNRISSNTKYIVRIAIIDLYEAREESGRGNVDGERRATKDQCTANDEERAIEAALVNAN